MDKALWWSQGGGLFLISEVTLYVFSFTHPALCSEIGRQGCPFRDNATRFHSLASCESPKSQSKAEMLNLKDIFHTACK